MDIKVARRAEQPCGTTCKYWLAGRCNRNPCRFSHALPSNAYYNANTAHYYGRKPHSLSEKTPKNNSKTALIRNSGDATHLMEAYQKSSPSVCRYWMNGNCVHGDQCKNLHSWIYGDGFSTLAKLHEHKKGVTGIALPVGSDKLYSGSTDGTVRTWDCHTGKCTNVINLGAGVTSLISEGPWIFVGLWNAVKAWNIQTAQEYTLNGPKGRVLAMIVGNDTLFAGAEDGVISAWRGSSDANSPFELVASLSGHTKAVVCLTVGGKRLYSGSMDQSIKVWVATEEGTLKVTYTHPVENGVVALSGMTDAEGKHILFCSCKDNSVRMYELPSFSEWGRLFARQEVRSIEIGPGGLFFTGDGTGLVMVWKWLEEPKVLSS